VGHEILRIVGTPGAEEQCNVERARTVLGLRFGGLRETWTGSDVRRDRGRGRGCSLAIHGEGAAAGEPDTAAQLPAGAWAEKDPGREDSTVAIAMRRCA